MKKIRKMGVCQDCGEKFNPPLSKEMLEYQKKYMDNEFVRVSCNFCIAKNHTITDEELKHIKKPIRADKALITNHSQEKV